LGSRLAQGTAKKSDNGRQTQTTRTKTNGSEQGEFTDLLDKIKSKNEGEK
jgi:hypothetical protein